MSADTFARMNETRDAAQALLAKGMTDSSVTTEDIAIAFDIAADAAEENGNKLSAEGLRGTANVWRTKPKGGNYNPNNVNEI